MISLSTYIFERLTIVQKIERLAVKICKGLDAKKIPEVDNKSALAKEYNEDTTIYKYVYTENNNDINIYINFGEHNHFDHKNSFKNNNDAYIEIRNLNGKQWALAHELRHAFDKYRGIDTEGTYDEDDNETQNCFDQFLYYICPTEQNGMYIGFKQELNNRPEIRNGIIKKYKQYMSKSKVEKSYDGFIEYYCQTQRAKRNEIMKINDKSKNISMEDSNEGKMEGKELEATYNPCRILEYQYYILNNVKSLKNFVERYDDKAQKKLKEGLSKLLKTDEVDINDNNFYQMVYNAIMPKYKKTVHSYTQLIKNFLERNKNFLNKNK